MKQLIAVCLIILCLFNSNALGFDVQGAISRMPVDQEISCGTTPETGIWMVARGIVDKDGSLSRAEMAELGLALAKKEIAAFFGTRVRSSEESGSTVKTTTVNGTEQSQVEEFMKEAVSIDVNQFLRGVAVVRVVEQPKELWVYCFTTGKVMSAAVEMERQKNQLPPNTVMSVGVSMLPGESMETQRQVALASAKRLAVEQVLGAQVTSTTQVQDSTKIQARIYANASGFVEEFRIVNEGPVQGGYQVQIIAKVAKDKLLSNYSSVMKSMGDPGFIIRTNQKDLYYSLSDFFSSLGIRIVTNPADVDYVIDATGDFRNIRHPATAIDGVQLSLWVRIFDAKTEQELFAIKNDPRRAAVFHAQGERQVELAAEKAYRQIKAPLHARLNAMLGKMAATGREVRICIDNFSNAFSHELEVIVKGVEMIPGCSNVNVNVDGITGVATIRLNYTATMEALGKFLAERIRKDIPYPVRRPKFVSFSNAELRLSY